MVATGGIQHRHTSTVCQLYPYTYTLCACAKIGPLRFSPYASVCAGIIQILSLVCACVYRVCACVRVCVWACVCGGALVMMVGTPVYNASGCEIEPHHAVQVFHPPSPPPPPPARPAVTENRNLNSIYRLGVDQTTHRANVTSGVPGGTSGAHTTNL